MANFSASSLASMKYIWGFLELLIYIDGARDENGLLDMLIESLTENVKSFLCNLGKYQWVSITSRSPLAYRKLA